MVVGVVERYHAFEVQPFCEPVEFVVKDEVGLVDGRHGTVVASFGECCHDVLLVLGASAIERTGRLAVLHFVGNGEEPSRRMVQLVEDVAVVAVLRRVWTASFFETGAEVHRERQVRGQKEVGVCTEGIATVARAGRIAVDVVAEILHQ